MCGIVGYKVRSRKNAPAAFQLFTRLMEESQIRGRHASGVAWVDKGRVRVEKTPLPAREFVAGVFWSALADVAPTEAIGHTRYSTSGDWRDNMNNQPLSTSVLAVVHNGLVSMAEKRQFEKAYAVRTETGNDTEVILRHVMTARGDLSSAFDQIYAVDPPIFACGFLDKQGRVTTIRDHIRPLWLFRVKSLGMTGFASTRDIIERAVEGTKYCVEVEEAQPYVEYVLRPDTAERVSQLSFAQPAEARFPRPEIKNPMMAAARFQDVKPTMYLKDHRRELRKSFKAYCLAAVSSWEIDPNYPLMNYLFRRYELSKSQEYWACFLYGTFYHPGSVFYVMQEFPEFEKVDLGRLSKWHAKNWRQLQYNTDRKYEKGHFVEMFESYRDVIGGQKPTSQEEFFMALLGADPVTNFRTVTAALHKLWHFGRYSVYIYTECLHRCMGMSMQADTMFLKEADSPRHGLCIVLGKPEWAEGPLAKEQWAWLVGEAEKLLHEIQREYPKLGMDHWLMESCLCAYKGYFRPTKGRYLPYYLDRMYNEISQMAVMSITTGVEWDVLRQFRRETIIPEYLGELARPPRLKVEKSMEHLLRDQGVMVGLEPIQQRGLLR